MLSNSPAVSSMAKTSIYDAPISPHLLVGNFSFFLQSFHPSFIHPFIRPSITPVSSIVPFFLQSFIPPFPRSFLQKSVRHRLQGVAGDACKHVCVYREPTPPMSSMSEQ
jgi:hypothetical protein